MNKDKVENDDDDDDDLDGMEDPLVPTTITTHSTIMTVQTNHNDSTDDFKRSDCIKLKTPTKIFPLSTFSPSSVFTVGNDNFDVVVDSNMTKTSSILPYEVESKQMNQRITTVCTNILPQIEDPSLHEDSYDHHDTTSTIESDSLSMMMATMNYTTVETIKHVSSPLEPGSQMKYLHLPPSVYILAGEYDAKVASQKSLQNAYQDL